MKLLVFSDTHNSSRRMLNVLAEQKDVDGCFFLGDGSGDAIELESRYPEMPLYSVLGNCDYGSHYPEDGLVKLGGVKIYYTHGHTLGVKMEMQRLWHHAKSIGADAALFGHTHTPYYEFYNGIHLFNPGSLSIPRGGNATYGTIQIEGGVPRFDIVQY